MANDRAFKTIGVEECRKALKESSAVLVDILFDARFDQVHAAGAVNACMYEIDFMDKMTEIAPDKSRAIVLCDSRAAVKGAEAAAEKLTRAGYENVFILQGGLRAWAEAGYELEGGDVDVLQREGLFRLPEGEFSVNLDKSMVMWTGRNANGRHYGTLRFSSGRLSFTEDRLSGELEVDMRSLVNLDQSEKQWRDTLIAHLLSDDFFFAERFPKAYFRINEAELVAGAAPGGANFYVRGVMEVRGVRAELEFPATVMPGSEGGLAVETHFDLDRTMFDVLYGSGRFFDHLGYHLVYDLVGLEITLIAE